MALVVVVGWTLIRVEVVHLNRVVALSGREQVTTICELNLTAMLNRNILELI